MITLTTDLTRFLRDVIDSDLSMDDFTSETFVFDFFSFEGMVYEEPDEDDIQRVIEVCQLKKDRDDWSEEEEEELHERATEIWETALRHHYENSYVSEYCSRIIGELEDTIIESFHNLTQAFENDFEKFGINLSGEPKFEVTLDWDGNSLEIKGNLMILDLILFGVMSEYGYTYDSYMDYVRQEGPIQLQRVKNNLSYLGEIESLIGTSYDLFKVIGLTELDRYTYFGDYDVTDEELIETHEWY